MSNEQTNTDSDFLSSRANIMTLMIMIIMMMVTRRRGKVVFISSKAGVSPSAGLAVHSGTKHMLEAVARALRQELSGTGVREL